MAGKSLCKREWVIYDSDAYRALLQQGYLVVPHSIKTVRRILWVQMQIMIPEEEA